MVNVRLVNSIWLRLLVIRTSLVHHAVGCPKTLYTLRTSSLVSKHLFVCVALYCCVCHCKMADDMIIRGGCFLRRVSFGISPSTIPQRPFFDEMSTPSQTPSSRSEPNVDTLSTDLTRVPTATSTASSTGEDGRLLEPTSSGSPRLSRNPSFTNSSSYQEDWEVLTPLDKLTVFDLLDNFALPARIEKWQKKVAAQTDKVRKSSDVGDSPEFVPTCH